MDGQQKAVMIGSINSNGSQTITPVMVFRVVPDRPVQSFWSRFMGWLKGVFGR